MGREARIEEIACAHTVGSPPPPPPPPPPSLRWDERRVLRRTLTLCCACSLLSAASTLPALRISPIRSASRAASATTPVRSPRGCVCVCVCVCGKRGRGGWRVFYQTSMHEFRMASCTPRHATNPDRHPQEACMYACLMYACTRTRARTHTPCRWTGGQSGSRRLSSASQLCRRWGRRQ